MRSTHHETYIRDLRHKYWIMTLLCFTAIGCWYFKDSEKIISPLSDNPVFAYTQPTPTPIQQTWKNVIKLIVDEFAVEGPQVTFQAISIAKAESGWRPDAVGYNTNNTQDSCPLQINSIHDARFGTRYKHDIVECIHIAHILYQESGWSPWTTARQLGYIK